MLCFSMSSFARRALLAVLNLMYAMPLEAIRSTLMLSTSSKRCTSSCSARHSQHQTAQQHCTLAPNEKVLA
jgi:hypothetical protein